MSAPTPVALAVGTVKDIPQHGVGVGFGIAAGGFHVAEQFRNELLRTEHRPAAQIFIVPAVNRTEHGQINIFTQIHQLGISGFGKIFTGSQQRNRHRNIPEPFGRTLAGKSHLPGGLVDRPGFMDHTSFKPFAGVDTENNFSGTGITVAAVDLIQRDHGILFPEKFHTAAFARCLEVLDGTDGVAPAEEHAPSVAVIGRELHGHAVAGVASVLSALEVVFCRIFHKGAALERIEDCIIFAQAGCAGLRKSHTVQQKIVCFVINFQVGGNAVLFKGVIDGNNNRWTGDAPLSLNSIRRN